MVQTHGEGRQWTHWTKDVGHGAAQAGDKEEDLREDLWTL